MPENAITEEKLQLVELGAAELSCARGGARPPPELVSAASFFSGPRPPNWPAAMPWPITIDYSTYQPAPSAPAQPAQRS